MIELKAREISRVPFRHFDDKKISHFTLTFIAAAAAAVAQTLRRSWCHKQISKLRSYAEMKLSDWMFQVMQLILTNQSALFQLTISCLLSHLGT